MAERMRQGEFLKHIDDAAGRLLRGAALMALAIVSFQLSSNTLQMQDMYPHSIALISQVIIVLASAFLLVWAMAVLVASTYSIRQALIVLLPNKMSKSLFVAASVASYLSTTIISVGVAVATKQVIARSIAQ